MQDAAVGKAHAAEFQPVRLVTTTQVFGGWDKVAQEHFANGGILDKAIAKAAAAR